VLGTSGRLRPQELAEFREVVALAFAGRVGDVATRRRCVRRGDRRRWGASPVGPRVVLRVVAPAVPVRLVETVESAPAALRLAGVVMGDPLRVDRSGTVAAMKGGWRPSAVTQLQMAWCFGR